MTARDLAAVLIRLFGLYLLVTLVVALPQGLEQGLETLADPDRSLAVWFLVTAALVKAILGIWLLRSGSLLASKIAPSGPPAPASALDGEKLLAVLTAIVGLWFIAVGLGSLIGQATSMYVYGQFITSFRLGGRPPDSWPMLLIPPLAQVLIGAILFLGSKRIAKRWAGRRTP